VVAQLLTLMDGIAGKSRHKRKARVLVVAATNRCDPMYAASPAGLCNFRRTLRSTSLSIPQLCTSYVLSILGCSLWHLSGLLTRNRMSEVEVF
jgi:hypothetical protein